MTDQTDFERIAGMRCPDAQENWHNSKGEHFPCQGTGYRFPWLWRACTVEHWSNPDDDVKSMGRSFQQACDEAGCTGRVLITGDGDRWMGLAKVALTLPRAIVITPHEWDDLLPEQWIKVGDFDLDVLASALVKIPGIADA